MTDATNTTEIVELPSSVLPTVTLVLGQKAYPVIPLPIKKAKAWRDRVRQPFSEIVKIIAGYKDVKLMEADGSFNAAGVAQIMQSADELLLGAVDLIVDLVISYSPLLEADREYIEDNAIDIQAVNAFKEVLRLAFPLGELRNLVSGLGNRMTSSNSQRPSGASLTVLPNRKTRRAAAKKKE